MLTLPEHLISPLVFIEVHVVLSFVSPYFMWLSCLLSFDCSFCLIAWYLYFLLLYCPLESMKHGINLKATTTTFYSMVFVLFLTLYFFHRIIAAIKGNSVCICRLSMTMFQKTSSKHKPNRSGNTRKKNNSDGQTYTNVLSAWL